MRLFCILIIVGLLGQSFTMKSTCAGASCCSVVAEGIAGAPAKSCCSTVAAADLATAPKKSCCQKAKQTSPKLLTPTFKVDFSKLSQDKSQSEDQQSSSNDCCKDQCCCKASIKMGVLKKYSFESYPLVELIETHSNYNYESPISQNWLNVVWHPPKK